MKFTIVIRRYSLTRSVDNPFKCFVDVRALCSFITSVGMDINQKICEGAAQKNGWIKIKIIKLSPQNSGEDKLNKDVVAGSNDEKISTIIKT